MISARGHLTPTATTDLAIASLTVRGRVEFGLIRAGYTADGVPVNADAQIGKVSVGNDWIASSLVAGVVSGNTVFGDADDAKMSGVGVKDLATISSRIESFTVNGQMFGTVGGADHFGIVAESVVAVTVDRTVLGLTSGKGNDDLSISLTGDFRINEV